MTYNWSIQLFAGLAERFGTSAITVETADGSMAVSDLKKRLAEAYPEHAALLGASFIARNHMYASDDTVILASDELAMLPPVSGGEPGPSEEDSGKGRRYVLTTGNIGADEVLAKVIVPEHGASIAFVGTTREWTAGKRTLRLSYEAYEPMAVRTMEQIGEEIAERWPGALCAITHRLGEVGIAETSVVIAVSAPHRAACYEASRYAIERLKQIVPIWKKEIWEDGSEWVGHQNGPWNPTVPLEHYE
ncbi:molybdenum cofactor biosynthesis protein [Paenibacillus protaetiae]|uniref:Molybdopterin synthase catalytic subunit n=1 Tax=Paenibacillus protaetiae TaxID=2509456 RepID=A0A4P6EQG9_9BACL|nr:molybdenum cofactor biosynthesis protein MoaE [Paenibacillus protaetiae]QAY65084.1 molybdopterin converting factor [Paenibacillus protaetiae]